MGEAAISYASSFKDGLRPDPDWTITQWADNRRKLPSNSSEPGQYRSSRTPYLIEIMDAMSPSSPVQEGVVMKPTQFGFTEVANNIIFGYADLYPCDMLFSMPTEKLMEKHSKKKISKSLKAMPDLEKKFNPSKSRDSGNTILYKEFPGGSLSMVGTNSPTVARSDSVKILIRDDYDGFTDDTKEGSTGELLVNRTDSYISAGRKIYTNSTPTLKGSSKIEDEFESSSQGHYNVPCPHCNKLQYLKFGGKDSIFGLKFKRDDDNQVVDAWYICEFCHERIDEHHKTWMLEHGKYIHKFPNRKKRGWKINGLFAPVGWVPWAQIATEFLNSKDNPKKLQRWTNTRMAEAFEPKGSRPSWKVLYARCEPYKPLTVPEQGLLLVSGIDVQRNRVAVVVRAFGHKEESWLVYHDEIYGDPTDQDWLDETLDSVLNVPFHHKTDGDIHILCMAVDSGDGETAHQVYNYARKRAPRVMAIKGANTKNQPILGKPTLKDVDWRGQSIKEGVQLWHIGTDTAKSLIYARYNIMPKPESLPGEPCPGRYHWPMGTTEEFFKQATAEKLMLKYVKGYPVYSWENVRHNKRNEVTDCEVYAYAAALRIGIQRMNWDMVKKPIQGKPRASKQQPKQRRTGPAPKKKNKWLNKR